MFGAFGRNDIHRLILDQGIPVKVQRNADADSLFNKIGFKQGMNIHTRFCGVLGKIFRNILKYNFRPGVRWGLEPQHALLDDMDSCNGCVWKMTFFNK